MPRTKIADRVLQPTAITGTGPYTLSAALTGYLAFSDSRTSINTGDTVSYFVVDSLLSPTVWELNRGVITFGAPDSLARGLVKSSTGSAIDWPDTSIKYLICCPNAADYVLNATSGVPILGWCGVAGGTPTALVLTPLFPVTAYEDGQEFSFVAGATSNAGPATVNVSGVGVVALLRNNSPLLRNEVTAGGLNWMRYYGGSFHLPAADWVLAAPNPLTLTQFGAL